MTLVVIGVMILAAFGVRYFRGARPTVLLFISVIALYALQPSEPILPTATLILVTGVWWLIGSTPTQQDYRLMALLVGAACLMSGFSTIQLIPVIGAAAVSAVGVGTLIPSADDQARRRFALAFIVLIIGLLVVLKLPALQIAVTSAASQWTRQPLPFDWQWLGFSYIAFRLMHVLLDFRSGRLRSVTPTLTLLDFALYVIFFPSLTAGPIDRVEHFIRELASPADPDQMARGALRIGIGIFKKFVLADALAYIALGPTLVSATNRPWLMWVLLYAFTLQIFFDFSGYTDIAIGIGLLAGIRLPENFTAPYSQHNITAFWNSWHITLSTWFRNYFFTPLSRALMSARLNRWLAIFIAQVSTMVLIGLWHGISIHFVLWGVWHGVGLWFHRWLVDHSRGWDAYVAERPRLAQARQFLSIVVTFHFVALGWIFFALPDLNLIGKAFAGLFGWQH